MAYVVKRGDRYTGYYRKGGKRLSAGTWANETEALYHAMKAQESGSDQPSRANMRLSDFVDRWLPNADLMPITKKGYGSVLRTHVLPRIGHRRLNQIDRRSIRELLDDLRSEGVGSATIGQVKASLGSALQQLVDAEELASNPTHGLKIKKVSSDFQNVLDPDEFKRIVIHLPTEGAQLFAKFLIASGCRFGEASEIRVKDINFKSGEVYVQRRASDVGMSNTKNGSRIMVIEATKSGHKRSVTLSKALLQEIKAYVSAKALAKDHLLFPKALVLAEGKIRDSREPMLTRPFEKAGKQFQHGTTYAYGHGGCRCDLCKESVRKYRAKARAKAKPYQKQSHTTNETSHLSRDVWRTTWNKAIAKSGIDWQPRTHDLRHANATQLLKNGVDVHEVKERLGHQSIKTTERYLHRIRNQRSKAGELANDYLE